MILKYELPFETDSGPKTVNYIFKDILYKLLTNVCFLFYLLSKNNLH